MLTTLGTTWALALALAAAGPPLQDSGPAAAAPQEAEPAAPVSEVPS